MKIYCEKCRKDISTSVNEHFDKNIVGYVICPNCMHKQSRYLSEADLLIYLTSIEIIFWLVSLIIFVIFNFVELSIIPVLIIIIMFISVILLTNKIKNNIYFKGSFKRIPLNKELNENPDEIKKSYRLQFIVFFACIIICITQNEGFWVFWSISFIALLFNVVKTILAINKEKNSIQ